MARTARQLEGRHLLFGEYLRGWTNLIVHYRSKMNLTSMDRWRLARFYNHLLINLDEVSR